MSEEKESWIGALGNGLKEWAYTPFPYLLGMAAVLAAIQWDGHISSQKDCYKLQKIDSKIYTVNSCTGDFKEAGK